MADDRSRAGGRPRRRPTAPARKLLQARVTDEEYAAAQRKADARGLSLSEWVRRRLGLARS